MTEGTFDLISVTIRPEVCALRVQLTALLVIIVSDVDRGQTPEDEDEDKITRPRTRPRTIFF